MVALALALAGWALAHLTRPAPPSAPLATEDRTGENSLLEGAYRLTLSAPPASLRIESAGSVQSVAEGRIAIDPRNPVVFVAIGWDREPEGHRFAKLTVDLPGKPTLTHVFEAPGDINDVWEIDIE